MIINEIFGITGIISGILMLISALSFMYFLSLASKYGSRQDANKFFGSYMLNNSFRYTLSFTFLVTAAFSFSVGFIVSFISIFFMNPLIIWEITSIIALASTAAFFITFTSIDNPKPFIDYINFLKNKH